ncbi:hypothetical protein JST99_04745 [Candidatus Dependentiae bacterium]|nr:hypothetical protein [Candidatus Dependentiae bacterium]
MNWKKKLHELEEAKSWMEAIEFMQRTINEHPDSVDAYLFLNYLLANMISEEQGWGMGDENKRNYIVDLLIKYIDESYEKFSHNAEYLFYTAKICGYADWYLSWYLRDENRDYKAMFEKAIELDPDNLFYKQIYLTHIYESTPMKEPRDIEFAKKVLAQDPSIKKIFDEKGALGESVWWSLTYNSREVLGLPRYSDEEIASWKRGAE